MKERKSRKKRKPNGDLKGNKEKKPKDEDSKAIQAGDEPSSGYIHVRARRGQATDSHSLAERVFLDVSFIYLFIITIMTELISLTRNSNGCSGKKGEDKSEDEDVARPCSWL